MDAGRNVRSFLEAEIYLDLTMQIQVNRHMHYCLLIILGLHMTDPKTLENYLNILTYLFYSPNIFHNYINFVNRNCLSN